MRRSRRRILTTVGLALMAAAGRAQEPPSLPMSWRFQVTPYLWGPGVKGTVQIPQIPELKVDAPFSDAISNLDVGLLGRFEGRKGDFGLVGDMLYLMTDAPFAADQPPHPSLLSPVGVKHFLADGIGFYRLVHAPDFERAYVDVLVGVRYFRMRAEVRDVDGAYSWSTSSWLDLIGGVRGRLPIGSRVALLARADVGGLGSKLSYNAEGSVDVSISKRWAVGAGYRYQDYEFETGLGADRRAASLGLSGPLLKATFTY